jgi:hypothetical protein
MRISPVPTLCLIAWAAFGGTSLQRRGHDRVAGDRNGRSAQQLKDQR